MPSNRQAPRGLPEHNQQSVTQQWLAILSVAVGAFALVTSEFLRWGCSTMWPVTSASVQALPA